jgi:hypothetical protein
VTLSVYSESSWLWQFMVVSVVCYLSVLWLSISILDDQTPMDSRILVPIYPVLLLMGFGFAASLKKEGRNWEERRWISSAVILLLLALQAFHSWPWLYYVRREGIGYASRMWQESSLLRQVKTLEPTALIFSNAPDVLYTLAGRPAHMLPRKLNPDTRLPNAQYLAQLGAMESKLKSSRGVIVYFDQVRWRRYLPDANELETTLALRALSRVADGTIYVVK